MCILFGDAYILMNWGAQPFSVIGSIHPDVIWITLQLLAELQNLQVTIQTFPITLLKSMFSVQW